MIVGQRPGASPRVLIIILAVLAAAWVVREATHRGAAEGKAPAVRSAAARPASIIVEGPPDSHASRP
ncbi:MAG TPA: hypothetical protein VK801_08240 [Caulobacteraceae bacterium]|nr:hypothetical protein [Caulobacteraceae bacterium]